MTLNKDYEILGEQLAKVNVEDYFKRMRDDSIHNLAEGIVNALQTEDVRIKAMIGYLIGENHDKTSTINNGNREQ